jgi:hypothetical protein
MVSSFRSQNRLYRHKIVLIQLHALRSYRAVWFDNLAVQIQDRQTAHHCLYRRKPKVPIRVRGEGDEDIGRRFVLNL